MTLIVDVLLATAYRAFRTVARLNRNVVLWMSTGSRKFHHSLLKQHWLLRHRSSEVAKRLQARCAALSEFLRFCVLRATIFCFTVLRRIRLTSTAMRRSFLCRGLGPKFVSTASGRMKLSRRCRASSGAANSDSRNSGLPRGISSGSPEIVQKRSCP